MKKTELSEKRQHIIESFLNLAMKIGVENITLEKIAKEAKVAFGTVRYHFSPNQMSLTDSAVLYVVKSGQNYVNELISQERMKAEFNGVHAYIRANFDWVQKRKAHASFLLHYYYLCVTQVKVVIRNNLLLDSTRVRIRGLVHESIGSGVYSSVQHVDELVLQIHSIVMGSVIIAGTEGSEKSYQMQCEIAIDAVTRIMKSAHDH